VEAAPAAEVAPVVEAAATAEAAPAGAQAGPDPDWQTLRAGRVIGALERWLIFTLVLHAQYSLVGLVLTAKSIARFRQLEEASFAEYYLLGTLYSLVIALFFGLGLRAMLP